MNTKVGAVREHLRRMVGDKVFDAWFASLDLALRGNFVVVSAPEFAWKYVTKFENQILRAAQAEAGAKFSVVKYQPTQSKRRDDEE